MSSGGGGSITTKTEPWEGQQPFLRDLFAQAQNMFQQGQGQEYYPGQQVADFSGATQRGMDQMTQQGMYGTGVEGGMQNFINQSMQNPGGMAGVGIDLPGQNPYLDQMYNTVAQRSGEQFQEQAIPGINSTFGGAGRTGGGIHQQVMGNAVDDFSQNLQQQAADIYGQDYTQGMNRDIQRRELMGDIGFRGGNLAPQFQGMHQGNIDQMMRSGAMQEDQAQRLIDAEMQRFNFGQQAPWQALGQYGGIVQGMPGGYGETTAPNQQGSRLSGMAGGAAAGSAFGPWGTAIGAGLGAFM